MSEALGVSTRQLLHSQITKLREDLARATLARQEFLDAQALTQQMLEKVDKEIVALVKTLRVLEKDLGESTHDGGM